MAMNLSGGYPRPFNNPNPSPTDQAQYLRQLIQATGSDQLKRMMTENQMSDEEVVQFVMEHPEEVRGAQGQGTSFAFASSGKSRSSSSASSASASSSSSSASASSSSSSAAPADSYSPSEEDDSEGDADLQAFSQDETMAAPSMCAMGGVTSADKAKPEMQQNLKECKAISKALAEMQKQDSESNPTLSIAVSIVVQKEQILRSCLKRGKGAADEAYKSQGIDPKDEGAVSAFVAKIGKEIMDQGISCGLEIEVSEKRADRLKDANGGGGKADEKGKNGEAKTADKTDKADKKDKVTTDKDKDKNKGVGKGEEGGGDDDDFKITTKKTDKQIEVGVDEIQGNPAMSGAIMEQLTALWDQKQQEGDGFKAPQTLDLGVTKKGSPLDQAFTNPNHGANGAPQQGQPGMPGMGGAFNAPQQGQTPGIGAANPGMAPMAPAAGGKAAGGAPRDLRRLMADLGMTGKKFNAKVQVYEPNAQVTMTKAGGGGVKVNGELKGKAISIKTPKMIGRAADGTVHKLGSLQRVGNNGSFMAAVKGDATGAESASKQLHTSGDGSISIPGAKAN